MAATPPPAGPSSPSSPSPTAVRSYLTPVTSLDSSSINTLKALLHITVDIRRSTAHTSRIQGGSPRAGVLGSTLAQLQPRLSDISDKLSEVLKAHEEFPGMYLVARQLPVFRDVLCGSFNDGGNVPGYNERVQLLEKLMYVSGTLRGHVEMVLEQSAYWRARLAGNTPRRLARRLNFDLAIDPAAVAEPDVGPDEIGPEEAVDAIGREFLTTDHTCKGIYLPPFLPQEALAALLSRDTFIAPEIEILRAVERWKEHNSKKVGEIATLLDCVRLSEFSSAEEVFREVEPTGLLDSQAILAGLRVMCKPCLSEMKPRGKIEKNKNLFTNSTVNFDPTTWPTIQQAPQQAQLPYDQGFGVSPPTKLCVADTVILMGERAKSRGYYKKFPTPSQLSPNTVIVALGDRYIINCLSIKGCPSKSDDDQVLFSYTVSISRDNKSWVKLFDYSSFPCWGTQNLPFPRQAARFVRLDLKWRENMKRELPLQFSACCLVSDPRPFAFLSNGVIAPRYDHDVVAMSQSHMKDEADGQQKELCWAVFRQPYSTSCLRFSLECSDKDIDSVDITVEVGLLEVGSGGEPDVSETSSSGGGSTVVQPAGGLQPALGQVTNTALPKSSDSGGSGQEKEDVKPKNKLKLKDIDKAPLNDPITVELKEKILNYIIVHIREMHCKPLPIVAACEPAECETGSTCTPLDTVTVFDTVDEPGQIVEQSVVSVIQFSDAVSSVVSSPPVSQVKTEPTVAAPILQSLQQAPQYPPTVQPQGLGLSFGSVPKLEPAASFSFTPVPKLEPAVPALGTLGQRQPFSFGSAGQAAQSSAATSQLYPPSQMDLVATNIFSPSSQVTQPLPQTASSAMRGKRLHRRQRRAENVEVVMAPSAAAVVESVSDPPPPLVQDSTASPVCFKIVNIVVKSSIQ